MTDPRYYTQQSGRYQAPPQPWPGQVHPGYPAGQRARSPAPMPMQLPISAPPAPEIGKVWPPTARTPPHISPIPQPDLHAYPSHLAAHMAQQRSPVRAASAPYPVLAPPPDQMYYSAPPSDVPCLHSHRPRRTTPATPQSHHHHHHHQHHQQHGNPHTSHAHASSSRSGSSSQVNDTSSRSRSGTRAVRRNDPVGSAENQRGSSLSSKMANASIDKVAATSGGDAADIPAIPPPPYTAVADDRGSLHSGSSGVRTSMAIGSDDPERASDPAEPIENTLFPVPTAAELAEQADAVLGSERPSKMLQWAKESIKHADSGDAEDRLPPDLVDKALRIIRNQAGQPEPVPEALFVRGELRVTGQFPHYWPADLRKAFGDFEKSARLGWLPGWYRIGQDYEQLPNVEHAKKAYERGVRLGDTGCLYRMGMAELTGQLGVPVDTPAALADLRRAADQADVDAPEASYVLGMLLAGEFSQTVPTELLDTQVSVRRRRRGSSSGASDLSPQQLREQEAWRLISRAAYLRYAPAQYKLGTCYEHARLDRPYDPLLSVQWYSFASQSGHCDADMALSKWFLCGAEEYFDKDEELAVTFASKAAEAELPIAMFAIGYYTEVGIGCAVDLPKALEWYRKAADAGNADAKDRLKALTGSDKQKLSRSDHSKVGASLNRSRTMAQQRSNSRRGGPRPSRGSHGAPEGAVPQPVPVSQPGPQPQPQPQARMQPRVASPQPMYANRSTPPRSPAPGQSILRNAPGPSTMRPQGSMAAPGTHTHFGLPPQARSVSSPTIGGRSPMPMPRPGPGPGPSPTPGMAGMPQGMPQGYRPAFPPGARPPGPSGPPRPQVGFRPLPPGRRGPTGPPPGMVANAARAKPKPKPAKPAGPQTFAEMGFAAEPLEKDCVVM